MGTIVCFHAHPDDESIATGGLMARAAAEGHRVVLVVATRGELGEIVPGVLADGEQLTLRRTAETYESARVLGVERVEFLGYVDSGMMGEATNDVPWAFWQADLDAAGARLATILEAERPDVFVVYDDNGGYGHPDHIQVHRVGMRAAELAGLDPASVMQSTINRTRIIEMMRAAADLEGVSGPAPSVEELPESFGKPAEVITHLVDATAHLEAKRGSMLCHRSQMADDHMLLALPPEQFAAAMGIEWFIGEADGVPPGPLGALFEPHRHAGT